MSRIVLDTAKLDQIIIRFPGESANVVKAGAFAVLGRAKVKAPYDTGNLKNSLHTEQKGELLWWVRDGVEYGVYQELGFHHWKSGAFIQNPFMVPAVESSQGHYTALWVALFRRL